MGVSREDIVGVDSMELGSVYDEREVEAVCRILRECIAGGRGISIGSPEIEDFEKKVAEYVGARNAVAVSSCGTGLDIAAQAIGIGPGDEAITTAITYQATAVCILKTGARPVEPPRRLPNIVQRRLELRADAVQQFSRALEGRVELNQHG